MSPIPVFLNLHVTFRTDDYGSSVPKGPVARVNETDINLSKTLHKQRWQAPCRTRYLNRVTERMHQEETDIPFANQFSAALALSTHRNISPVTMSMDPLYCANAVAYSAKLVDLASMLLISRSHRWIYDGFKIIAPSLTRKLWVR